MKRAAIRILALLATASFVSTALGLPGPPPASAQAQAATRPSRGSADSVPGRYVRTDKQNDYLEFYPDGTLFLRQDGRGYRGTYTIDAETITIRLNPNGVPNVGRYTGDGWVDPNGKLWEKKSAFVQTGTTVQTGSPTAAPMPTSSGGTNTTLGAPVFGRVGSPTPAPAAPAHSSPGGTNTTFGAPAPAAPARPSPGGTNTTFGTPAPPVPMNAPGGSNTTFGTPAPPVPMNAPGGSNTTFGTPAPPVPMNAPGGSNATFGTPAAATPVNLSPGGANATFGSPAPATPVNLSPGGANTAFGSPSAAAPVNPSPGGANTAFGTPSAAAPGETVNGAVASSVPYYNLAANAVAAVPTPPTTTQSGLVADLGDLAKGAYVDVLANVGKYAWKGISFGYKTYGTDPNSIQGAVQGAIKGGFSFAESLKGSLVSWVADKAATTLLPIDKSFCGGCFSFVPLGNLLFGPIVANSTAPGEPIR